MKATTRAAAIAALTLILAGGSGFALVIPEQGIQRATWPIPVLRPAARAEVGLASWYGPGFHGQTTASGAVFDQNDLTAAHPDLPLGTLVKVTNLRNGRSVEVVVNDRGPFVDGRVIDLSKAAAAELKMVRQGLAKVKIEILDEPRIVTVAQAGG